MRSRFVASAVGLSVLSSIAVAQEQDSRLEEVVVMGSRIPRVKAEGPAPVTTISADDIVNQGLTSVPDVLKALTQNNGDALGARFTVDNLTDEKPEKDPTYASYPYYDISWFDSMGRTVYFTVEYKFGGQ